MKSRRNKNPAPVRCILCFCYVSLSLVWLLLHWTYMQKHTKLVSKSNWFDNCSTWYVSFFSFQYHSGSRANSAVHCLYPKEQACPWWLLSATRPDWVGFPVCSGCSAGFLSVSNAWSTSSGRLQDILTDSEDLQTWTSQINRLCCVYLCLHPASWNHFLDFFWQIKQLSNGAGVQ